MFFKRLIAAVQFAWAERKGMVNPDLKRDEIAFLPSELELIHTPVHPAPRILTWSVVCISFAALVWACIGRTDLVATASGRIISATHTKVVQPFATGTVKQILVRDGERVHAGQQLVVLDATEAQADERRAFELWQAARLSQLRSSALLLALESGKSMQLEIDARIEVSAFSREQVAAKSQWGEYQAKLTSLRAQAAQRLALANENLAEIGKLSKTLPIIKQREADYQALANDKFMSEHAVQDRRAQRIQMEGDLATLNQKSAELSAGISEIKAQILTLTTEFQAKLAKENVDAAAAAAQLEQELAKSSSQAKKTILTSPVDGVVQQLAVHTIGGVVTPAQAIMQVVPIGEEAIVEAWVENKDIGFIHPNQKAEVKIETFEHTKYGTLPGRVLTVSADAIQDDKKGLGYIAKIRLDRSYMIIGERKINISPGLAVTSEINIGTKRIIEYVLAPMLEAASAAVPR